MDTFRVLWTDGDGNGRWADVDAEDPARATWATALHAGQGTAFIAVAPLPAR